MSADPETGDHLSHLLSALEDGTLDAAGEARLIELLRDDPAARAQYYNHVLLSALLRREGRRVAAQNQSHSQRLRSSDPRQPGSDDAPRPMVVALTGRSRPWLLALATSVLLGLLLSVSEATGVTRLVPTIIRIVTGEGSLVIEVDDPGVSVTLDGEDLRITGAGIHELRLRPGTHKFVATRNGQPVREEAVTIEQGGRRIVKVSRQPLAPAGQPEREQRNAPALTAEIARPTEARDVPISPRRGRVLLVIAPRDFFYPEYGPVKNALEMHDVACVVASTTLDECQPNSLSPQVAVKADLLLSDAHAADYSAIYFCGGQGIEIFAAGGSHANSARRLIEEALAAGRLVSAMGIGAVVLAEAGALDGKQATCSPYGSPPGTYVRRLRAAGAVWHDEPVVEDGLVVTGRQPADINLFIRALVKRLEIELQPRPPPPGD